jgi:hypothetical protein
VCRQCANARSSCLDGPPGPLLLLCASRIPLHAFCADRKAGTALPLAGPAIAVATLPSGFVGTCGSGYPATPCLRMHDAYLNAAAAGLVDAVVLGELDEDPQALISKDAIETTTRGRMRRLLRLVDRWTVTSHIGR